MSKHADITIWGDPVGGNVYWVDIGVSRSPVRYLAPGSIGLDHLQKSPNYRDAKTFRKGSTVLNAIDKALWDEWGERADYASEERSKGFESDIDGPATLRIVYHPEPGARKRIIAHVKVTRHGVGMRLTPYGAAFKRAKAIYPG
jgi:hypothetical protein